MHKQIGRPKKANPKSCSVEFRLSLFEKEAFQDAADLAGIDLSTWIRERLRRSAIKELEESARPIAFIQEIHTR